MSRMVDQKSQLNLKLCIQMETPTLPNILVLLKAYNKYYNKFLFCIKLYAKHINWYFHFLTHLDNLSL